MTVSVEKVSNVERRVTIVVPANQVEEAYTKQINKLAKDANIKGFRPGKAPMNVITQRYGNEARSEALNEVIQKSLYEAISEHKLQPVSTPQVEPKVMQPNQPLEFVASFEVLPEIENIAFNMDSVEKVKVDVTPDDVDLVISQLLKQYTKWKQVDRAAQEKDRVVIDYYAIFEGKSDEENKVQAYPLELGSKVMLPGFEEALVGVKAGEKRHLKLSFPADFQVADRAGKEVEFDVDVKQVYEAEAPEMTEDFIKRLGVKSGQLADLKEQIRKSLDMEKDRLIKEKLKDQVFRKLLELNPLDVPKALVEREARNIHDEIYPQHQHHDHHSHSEEETAAFNDIAKKRVALGLLISQFAKQAELKLDQDLVRSRIQEIATAYENPPEVVEWLSAPERRSGVEAQVMEDQVLNKLLEGVTTSEKAMTYAELRGAQQQQ